MSFRVVCGFALAVFLGSSVGCASGSQVQKPEAEAVVVEADVEADASVLVGTWLGKLDVGGISLTIVFNVERSPELVGGWVATMDSPDQGTKGIPVSEVVFEDGRVQFIVAVAHGVYEGTLGEDGESIVGSWSQGGQSFPLNLELGSAEEVQGPLRPQEPQPPYPYASEEVQFAGGRPTAGSKEAVVLAGTLTLPKSAGPHPAVVLLTGSGPQDRDSTILGHKPFWVLADYLSRRGVAVLRIDDRGVAGSTGVFEGATTADFVTDAVAAVNFLSGRDDIDQRAIGLVGHSEGGIVAPMASVMSEKVGFVVLMAPPAVRGAELLARQNALIFEASGISAEGAAAYEKGMLAVLKTIIKEPLDEPLSDEVREQVRADFDVVINALSPEDRALFSGENNVALDKIVDPMVEQLGSVWMRNFLVTSPEETLVKLKVPTLALFGSKDLQVAPEQNAGAFRKHLVKNPDATVVVFEGLNHLFQPAETGLLAEYSVIETTLDPVLLETIAAWLEERGWAGGLQDESVDEQDK